MVTGAKPRAWLHFWLVRRDAVRSKPCMKPPGALDVLTPAQLKELVVEPLGEVAEPKQTVGELHEEIAGRWCYGKTPMQTFIDTLPLAKEKLLQAA
jgi:hypothetical protein